MVMTLRSLNYLKSWPLGQAVKTPPFHGGNRGSSPLGVTILPLKSGWLGRIAQLGEHLPYKQGVTGSSPVAPTKLVKFYSELDYVRGKFYGFYR